MFTVPPCNPPTHFTEGAPIPSAASHTQGYLRRPKCDKRRYNDGDDRIKRGEQDSTKREQEPGKHCRGEAKKKKRETKT
jgi:hypothetical protein